MSLLRPNTALCWWKHAIASCLGNETRSCLPHLSTRLHPGLTSSHSAVGFRVPLSRVQPSSPVLVHHPKICRPTAKVRDTFSPSDNSFLKSPLPPHPTCLPTAFFVTCKLGLNLQWCHLYPCLEPSPVPSLAWHIALEASAPPNSIPTLVLGLLVL